MSDLLDMLCKRRSVRKYTEDEVTDEQLEKILQAGLLSPSGRGRTPWEFIVVRDRETLRQMAGCREGSAKMLEGASCAVAVLGDSEKTDTVTEDCSIAMAYMHLMADSLGLGSCWIQARLRQAPDGRSTEEYLRELLGYGKQYRLEAILSVGVPDKKGERRELPQVKGNQKVHWERF